MHRPAEFTAMPQCIFMSDHYMDDLDKIDMNENEKVELLQTLWQILSTIVEISWGEDAIQKVISPVFKQTVEDCETLPEVKH